MSDHRPSNSQRTNEWRWASALPLLPIALFCVAVFDERWWAWLGINHLQAYFVDVDAILAAAKAHVLGLDVYARNPFDPFGRPHVYGPWWLALGWLGLDVPDAWWVGALVGALFLGGAALILRPRGPAAFAYCGALLTAPPVMLALERANNDLVVFALFVLAGELLVRPSSTRMSLGTAVLVTAAALKLYPAAALGCLLQGPAGRRRFVWLAAAVLGCGSIAWYWRADYAGALAHTPRPTSMLAYGSAITVLTWKTLAATRVSLALGALVAVATFAVPLFRARRALWRLLPNEGRRSIAAVAGGLSWIACYAVASNYGYRLTLLLLPAAAWLARGRDVETGRAARLQLLGWLLVFWAPVLKRVLAMAALSDAHPGAPRALSGVLGFEQMLVLVLTAALAFQVLGVLVRAWAQNNR